MEKRSRVIDLYNLNDLEEMAYDLKGDDPEVMRLNLRDLWRMYQESKQDPEIWPTTMRQWIRVKDEKPKARCGYFTVRISLKGWDTYGDIGQYSYDITEAICKLTGDTYRKDGTIKVGSSSAQGWSFSNHLEERIMRSI